MRGFSFACSTEETFCGSVWENSSGGKAMEQLAGQFAGLDLEVRPEPSKRPDEWCFHIFIKSTGEFAAWIYIKTRRRRDRDVFDVSSYYERRDTFTAAQDRAIQRCVQRFMSAAMSMSDKPE